MALAPFTLKTTHARMAILASAAAFHALLSGCASTPTATPSAGPPWAGETFLPNYSELQPVGKDWVFHVPNVDTKFAGLTNGVMVDQPEIFISPQSPYTGAKPADLTTIAEFTRSTFEARITAHGYKIVNSKGPGVLYIRSALTNLELKEKSRSVLDYTPTTFVISEVYRSLENFLKKMDIHYIALQAQFLDADTGQELGAGVVPRGGSGVEMTFDQFKALIEGYGDRIACRLDNGRVPESQRIDCTDPEAVKARPKIQ
jgi:Protein of unknown function (DUF3313)